MRGTPMLAPVAGVLVCGTPMFAPSAGVLVCGTRVSVARTGAGAFYAAPENPSRGLSKVGGVLCALAIPTHTPPLCSPHGGVPPPPEGTAASGFPLGLLLAGGGEKNGRGQ